MATNRLGTSASAYLRAAAHQPVAWHPWGPEAFREAGATDRPVLLDIGAIWCHWCHVMDAESYEDPSLAAFLNTRFVCVKVDRDELPEVDLRYQRAVQALARQGGWPLTGFLTAEGELFFGGTYFPPEPATGMPSFRQVLERVDQVWRRDRESVTTQARRLREALDGLLDETHPGDPRSEALADASHRILTAADREYGGFGSQPKFPHPATLTFLLHRWCDAPESSLRGIIEKTLDSMANGGFRDQLGGGFHRYSVDRRWIVPHFEKLASDNAELLGLYAAAGSLFERADWLSAAGEVVRWFAEVLAQPEGGFGASQDADRGPGDDGTYFTWSLPELEEVLTGTELPVALARFGIGAEGRMPHQPDRHVLFTARSVAAIATERALSPETVQAILERIEGRLRSVRAVRPAPAVDPTRYANWNGMVSGALIRAGPVVGGASARHGLAALERIRREQVAADLVAHRPGGDPGLLDDPVQCAAAALDAWEHTGNIGWLGWSEALMERVWADHWDLQRGGFEDLSRDRRNLGLLRASAKPIQDSPNASPNGVAGITLARLYQHTHHPAWRERHRLLVTAFGGVAAEAGLFASAYLLAVDWLVHPATHLLITGPPDDDRAQALHDLALAAFIPRRVVIRLLPETAPATLSPALAALRPAAAEVRAVACVGDRCLLPTDDPATWRGRLRSLVPAGAVHD